MITEHVTVEIDEEYMDYLTAAGTQPDPPGEVVMVLPRPANRVLVSTKRFYPEGVFRLPTGKIKPAESPEQAFVRETREETGLDPAIESKIALVVHHCSCRKRSVDIRSHVFLASLTRDDPQPTEPREQITAYREVAPSELIAIADRLRALPGKWGPFGRFRASVHELVARSLSARP